MQLVIGALTLKHTNYDAKWDYTESDEEEIGRKGAARIKSESASA